MTAPLTRRAALQRAAFIAAGAAVGSQFLAGPGYASARNPELNKLREAVKRAEERARQRKEHVSTGIPSKNGWEMEKVADDRGHIYTRPAPGTPIEVQVRMGEVETILVHVIRRFHYEVDTLLSNEDVVGWRAPHTVRRNLAESNQASGTAVQIRPGHYPASARGGFYPQQELVIRDILAELDGVVRWGGDDRKPDESLFYIDLKPGDPRLAKAAQEIRGWKDTPGMGAGSGIDITSPARRSTAKKLARLQRTHG
ncbi:hypothetical protein ACH35V_07020 [Actinomadura sp. 1N219]|uniref:hypothetical protein n=1 Tax=Actinomadura sp. 1N219 TaxID=3375152 RepID=UPI0037B96507